jgi:hypothetical protein
VGGKAGGEMTQALYAHMNNKTIKKNVIVGIIANLLGEGRVRY